LNSCSSSSETSCVPETCAFPSCCVDTYQCITAVEGNTCTGCEYTYDTTRLECQFEEARNTLIADLPLLETETPNPRCITGNWVFNFNYLQGLVNRARNYIYDHPHRYNDTTQFILGDLYNFVSGKTPPIILNNLPGPTLNPWVLSDTAGAVIQIQVLYASLTEYILVYKAPLGMAPAFGGVWEASFYDYAISGSVRSIVTGQDNWAIDAWPEYSVDASIANTEPLITAIGSNTVYQLTRGSLILEYARGDIPSLIELGYFVPTQFFTEDYQSALFIINLLSTLVQGNCFSPPGPSPS